MGLLTGLFRATRKRMMTSDNDMGTFRDKLNELVAQKDSLSDEEITAKVEELKGVTNDLPDNDDKSQLLRFLEDFKSVKEQDAEVAGEAAKAVADMFEKLDTEAMKDVPGAETETSEIVEETLPEEESADGDVETEIQEEKKTEAEDADPNAEYSLEEIYQFIKKRMAEDAACETSEEEETTDGDDEDEEKTVTDCAPSIPVTLGGNAKTESLASMFNQIKGGR